MRILAPIILTDDGLFIRKVAHIDSINIEIEDFEGETAETIGLGGVLVATAKRVTIPARTEGEPMLDYARRLQTLVDASTEKNSRLAVYEAGYGVRVISG